MKRKIIISTLIITGALAAGTLGFATVSAQEAASYPPIVQKLAEKFGLKQEEVMEVFQEVNDERQADMEARLLERLSDAVTDGKITEAQKQTILDKHEQMQAKMDEFRDLAPEERKEKMQAYHEELRTWAEENDIDFPFMVFKALKPGFGHGFKAGMVFDEKLN